MNNYYLQGEYLNDEPNEYTLINHTFIIKIVSILNEILSDIDITNNVWSLNCMDGEILIVLN